jgi:PIN domain nuclease of toxin-antitoxin system
MKIILLDTHAAIWSAERELSRETQRAIDDAAAHGSLLLSPVSAWEIGMLHTKGRLQVMVPIAEYVRSLFQKANAGIAELTADIALAATTLPGDPHGDPMDRMLIATAAAYGAEFMTHDAQIHAYAKRTKYVRCIACPRST